MKIKVTSFFITFLLVFILSLRVVSAQEISITTIPSLTPTPTVVIYELPYPGILPGHLFYFLKSARDKFWGFLISNALKKAEFDLLQADKSFASAEILFKKNGDTALILSTLAEGRMYFEDAIKKSGEANKQGMDSSDLVKRMRVANIRHQGVVYDMTQTNNKEDKKKFAAELEKVKELGKKTNRIDSK